MMSEMSKKKLEAAGNCIRNCSDSRSYPCKVITPGIGHLDELMELQTLCLERLEDKTFFVPLSRDEYLDVLGEKGVALGITVNDKLVAFTSAFFPGDSSENLGRDLLLPKEELAKVCHLDLSFVHPDFRGNGLQRSIAFMLVDAVRKYDFIRYLCCTIKPENITSLNSSLALDLYIHKLKNKYGGLKRFILLRDLQCPEVIDKENYLAVPSDDIIRQKQLLKEGYRGFKQMRAIPKSLILYGKSMNASAAPL